MTGSASAGDESAGPAGIVGAATLLILLLSPIGSGFVAPAVLLLAGAGLLVPGLRARSDFWWTVAALALLRVVLDWPMSDNHAYLLSLWCFTLGLAATGPAARAALAPNARWLLGIVFAAATLQKAWLSPDYLDGTFFRVLLATDPRFEGLALLCGLDLDSLNRARDALLARPAELGGPTSRPPSDFVRPPLYDAVALFATWYTVAIEALVAAGYLLPARWTRRWRDLALLVFCSSVYALAPVEGFGWLLLAMGYTQLTPERDRLRVGYAIVASFLLFTRALSPLTWITRLLLPDADPG